MTITLLPTPPSRNDPTNFATRSDTFLAALPTFGTEANDLANEVNAASSSAMSNAITASAAASAAQAAALAQAASKWVSGSYTEGSVVWSPTNGKAYRRKAPGGSSPTDPAADSTNWYDVLSLTSLPKTTITSNTSAQVGVDYLIANTLELLLPISPNVGDVVGFVIIPEVSGITINPNGAKIRGNTETMQVDIPNASAILVYSGNTYGWI